MMIPLAILFALWLAFCFAKLEITIEGADGWAGKLPTWRSEKRLSRILAGGHTLTGYHLWTNVYAVSLMHGIYFFVPFAPATECFLLAFYCFFLLAEDFLWFALNPAFGLRNFNKNKIWWHADHWWIFAPRDYYVFAMMILVLLYIGTHI